MRRLVDRDRLMRFMAGLGREARTAGRVYLTGGASAVLFDWRKSTIDVDLKLEPDNDEMMRAIPALKETLEVNVELASPGDFIPELPHWRERSLFITREGSIDFHHYDFYAQALSKLERGHARDLDDVANMRTHGLIQLARLSELFSVIEPELYRYPAIDPRTFRRRVEKLLSS